MGYEPAVVTDSTKPEGVAIRRADPNRMLGYYQPQIGLREGISDVLDWLR